MFSASESLNTLIEKNVVRREGMRDISASIATLIANPQFALEELLKNLDSQAHHVANAGRDKDQFQQKKNEMLTVLGRLKMELSVAEASAMMRMPETAKNDAARKAFIALETTHELAYIAEIEGDIMSIDSEIMVAQREYSLQQDRLSSLHRKADIISNAMRFLSAF